MAETGSAGGGQARLRVELADRLADVRRRTFEIIGGVTEAQFEGQPAPVMGTVAWDVGHIGAFEELWLVDRLDGPEVGYRELSETFDPIHHPRSERGQMTLPSPAELEGYLDGVRKASLDLLDRIDLEARRLTRDGFVYDLIVRHEQQHQESMLITLQLMEADPRGPAPEQPDLQPLEPYQPPMRQPKPDAQLEVDGMAEVPGGAYEIGTDAWVGHYDNERPAHTVDVAAFRIDRAPVTNRDYLAFIEDGGYEEARWWSEDGWLISQALHLKHPRFWRLRDDGTWRVREYDRWLDLGAVADQPVVHVSYYEAEAYATWAGKRLPTETEWEVAATWDPGAGTRTTYPWGDGPWRPELANLGQRLFGPAPVGAYPAGASPIGCHQMAGDVWEWTSSIHAAYPGFEAYPYDEYAKLHFDSGYQVLRGGSWATWPACATGTFRNWHQPDHQQLFAGFRCAEDVSP